jgi:hypothetical protein
MITSIQNTRDIKIVRAVWGDMDLTTIPQSPQYNEVVYVWGTANKLQLDSMGYTTILCDKNPLNFKYTSSLYEFIHKLIAIQKACNAFSKILFLDWDYVLEKELDDNFFNYLNTKTFVVPIYEYDYEDHIDTNINSFLYNKINFLKNYSWKVDSKFIIPNAGFIYISDSNIGNNLLQIAKDNDIKTFVEEFTIYKWADCTLDEYIQNYHPTICFGRNSSVINEYVESLISMDIYFRTI